MEWTAEYEEMVDVAIRWGSVNGWTGADLDDVRQEARIALLKAIGDYRADRGSFRSFGILAIRRWLISMLIESRRLRRRAPESPLRLDAAGEDFDEPFGATVAGGADVAAEVERREEVEAVLTTIAGMTELERTAIVGIGIGLSYDEIGPSRKAIDNAAVRARRKLSTVRRGSYGPGVLSTEIRRLLTPEETKALVLLARFGHEASKHWRIRRDRLVDSADGVTIAVSPSPMNGNGHVPQERIEAIAAKARGKIERAARRDRDEREGRADAVVERRPAKPPEVPPFSPATSAGLPPLRSRGARVKKRRRRRRPGSDSRPARNSVTLPPSVPERKESQMPETEVDQAQETPPETENGGPPEPETPVQLKPRTPFRFRVREEAREEIAAIEREINGLLEARGQAAEVLIAAGGEDVRSYAVGHLVSAGIGEREVEPGSEPAEALEPQTHDPDDDVPAELQAMPAMETGAPLAMKIASAEKQRAILLAAYLREQNGKPTFVAPEIVEATGLDPQLVGRNLREGLVVDGGEMVERTGENRLKEGVEAGKVGVEFRLTEKGRAAVRS